MKAKLTPKQLEAKEKKLQQLKDDERLIEEVKTHRLLFDTTLKDFKDAAKRRTAWREIATSLSLSEGN